MKAFAFASSSPLFQGGSPRMVLLPQSTLPPLQVLLLLHRRLMLAMIVTMMREDIRRTWIAPLRVQAGSIRRSAEHLCHAGMVGQGGSLSLSLSLFLFLSLFLSRSLALTRTHASSHLPTLLSRKSRTTSKKRAPTKSAFMRSRGYIERFFPLLVIGSQLAWIPRAPNYAQISHQ